MLRAVRSRRQARAARRVHRGRPPRDGAQAFATDGVLIDIRKLDRVLGFDMERGLIEVESGMQWPKLLAELTEAQRGRAKQWGFAQKQTGAGPPHHGRLPLGERARARPHASAFVATSNRSSSSTPAAISGPAAAPRIRSSSVSRSAATAVRGSFIP